MHGYIDAQESLSSTQDYYKQMCATTLDASYDQAWKARQAYTNESRPFDVYSREHITEHFAGEVYYLYHHLRSQ